MQRSEEPRDSLGRAKLAILLRKSAVSGAILDVLGAELAVSIEFLRKDKKKEYQDIQKY